MFCRRLGGLPKVRVRPARSFAPGGFGAVLVTFLSLLFPACARKAPEPVERLAILRFENLGAEASADWLGRALSEIVAAELAGAPRIYVLPSSRIHTFERVMGARPVAAPGISAERGLGVVAGANRLGYGEYALERGRLQARLTLEDPQTGKVTGVYTASAPAGDALAVGSALARQLWPGAHAYATRNQAALRAYVAALEATDAAVIAPRLEEAIAADPDFAPAYRLLAQFQAQAQNRPAALETLRRALGRKVQPLDRARLEVDAAEMRGEFPARRRALNSLAKLLPADAVRWRALGEAETNARAYAASANAYRRALEVEPQDGATLNQLAYAEAYAGNLAAATEALDKYRALRPAEANPLDSLGDVHLLHGRLKEAENFYLEAARKTPHFQFDGALFKAAMARLMTGDVAGADALAKNYLQARASGRDLAVEYRAAEWAWAAGRRQEACRRIQAFARAHEDGPLRELSSRAYAELAIWRLMLGDRAAASESAARAVVLGGTASAGIASVARFLTQPEASSEEWASRAGQRFNQSAQASLRELALAYALLLKRDYQRAGMALQGAYNSGATLNGEGLPVLLGWALLENGRTREAADLLRLNPIPSESGTGPFFSFYFPRLYHLRAEVARREGRADEAGANLGLFRKLSGPDALVWDR